MNTLIDVEYFGEGVKIPRWVRYMATYPNGFVWGFSDHPIYSADGWMPISRGIIGIGVNIGKPLSPQQSIKKIDKNRNLKSYTVYS